MRAEMAQALAAGGLCQVARQRSSLAQKALPPAEGQCPTQRQAPARCHVSMAAAHYVQAQSVSHRGLLLKCPSTDLPGLIQSAL